MQASHKVYRDQVAADPEEEAGDGGFHEEGGRRSHR